MSSSTLPIVLGGVLLAGFALAAAGKGSASSTPAPSSGTPAAPKTPAPKTPAPPQPATAIPPQSVIDRIVAAVATQNADAMRKVATEIEREGWVLQADDLRRAADIATYLKAGGLKPPGTVVQGDAQRAPSSPQPWSPMPGVIRPQVSPPELHPKRLQAQMLVREMEKPTGKEDRSLVAAFQANNGLKASGYYTPGTAICLAERYGLVPPAPYWPTSGRVKAKANYRQRLLAIAKSDPQREEEFRRAADKV